MTQPLPLPLTNACQLTMDAVLVDPLDPGPEAETHLQNCRACSEARVAFLAQEEVPLVLAPAGYFERLPSRIMGKLPARSRSSHTLRYAWGAAAALLLAVGATAFGVGRANRAPLVEANLVKTTSENQELLPDTPFQDGEDALTQLTALSQEDADAVMRALSSSPKLSPAGK